MKTKICRRCKEEKILSEFGVENRSKDGFNTCCKKCNREIGSISYYKNIEKSRESRRKSSKKYNLENKEKVNAAYKIYRSNNKEKISERSKKWREENKEEIRSKASEHYKNNKDHYREKSRNKHLINVFGIDYIQYMEMLDKQNGVCAICGNPEVVIEKRTGKIKALAVDHDHNTGKIRGLLCYCCNKGIGYLKDNKEIIKNAYVYLERSTNE
jgi:gas vesicle protein